MHLLKKIICLIFTTSAIALSGNLLRVPAQCFHFIKYDILQTALLKVISTPKLSSFAESSFFAKPVPSFLFTKKFIIPAAALGYLFYTKVKQAITYSFTNPKDLARLLITNPQKVLDHLMNTWQSYDASIDETLKNLKPSEEITEQNAKLYIEKFLHIFEQKEREDYLFPLYKRSPPHSLSNNVKNSTIHSNFKNEITQDLPLNRPLHYVSLNPNGCFQDLVILTKLLTKNSTSDPLSISFIENQDSDYLQYLQHANIQNNNEVKKEHLSHKEELSSIAKFWYTSYEKEWNNEQPNSRENLRAKSTWPAWLSKIFTIFLKKNIYKKVLEFLSTTFPEKKISLYVYSSAKDFLDKNTHSEKVLFSSGTSKIETKDFKQLKEILMPQLSQPITADSLTQHTLENLKLITHDHENFVDDFYSFPTNNLSTIQLVEGLKELLNKYKNKNILFLSGECTSENCPLSRYEDSTPRETFEREVVDLLNKKIKEKSPLKKLHYVNFGSCGTFNDLLVLTNFLKQNPKTHVTVSFIDLKNKILAQNMKSPESPSPKISFDSPLFSFSSQIKDRNRPLDSTDAFSIAKATISFHTYFNILTWLKINFPLAQIDFYIYENVEKFKASNSPQVDIVTGVDFKEDQPDNEISEKDFKDLCEYCLSKNPNCKTLALYCNWPNRNLIEDFIFQSNLTQHPTNTTSKPDIILKEWKIQENKGGSPSFEAKETKLT